MKFTWLTYRLAIRRSFNAEYELFCGGIGTTSAWVRQKDHTTRLRLRQAREWAK